MKGKKLITALLVLGIAGTATSAIALTACKKKSGSSGRTIYVSVDGGDVEEAKGTKADPLSLRAALVDYELLPGDTVRVMPGVYEEYERLTVSKDGEHNKYIHIVNDNPEEKAVISFYTMRFASTNRGVQIYSDYLHWDGIDVCGAGDNGMYIGGSYNIIENCEFYDNRDTGLQLGRSYSPSGNLYQEYADINYWPSYNLIKNCTSYNNYDNETYGENADGFAAKLTVGYGNVFDGCIAYRNSDDGWDLYAKSESGNIGAVIMYNCVAFENGYILETQEEFNKKFRNFNTSLAEGDTSKYSTECGDGNGFKLGGSIMEGEVFMQNCLSFNNRMHGVTDNSNPGVLTISGITSYNNGAGVDKATGNIAYVNNGVDDGCGNINMARQVYSYNHLANVLSVIDGSNYTSADEFRGTVENSTFSFGSGVVTSVEGQDEYDTKNKDRGAVVSSPVAAADLFKALPALDLGFDKTLHKKWRNADMSVNLGDLFALKNGSDGRGAVLNKTKWEDYPHYSINDLTKCSSADEAKAQAVLDMTYMPIRTEACYQNFKLVTKIKNVDITWTSSDPSLIEITDIEGTSNSGHKDVRALVHRPIDKDKIATVTATVTVGGVTKIKNYDVNVKKNTFRVGEFVIDGVENGEQIIDKTADMFDFSPAVPSITNGLSDGGDYIDASYYELRENYKYATYAAPTEFKSEGSFDPTKAGIWKVTNVVTLNDKVITIGKSKDGSATADQIVTNEYLLYVADRGAAVSFSGTPEVTVNKNGYKIDAQFQSPTGYIYSVTAAADSSKPTFADLKANADAVKTEFRSTGKAFDYAQANSKAYKIYYALENIDGTASSDVYEQEIKVQNISSKADFEAMLASNNTSTIYMLTQDINFSDSINRSSEHFVGVFNGNGHKISNITIVNETKVDNVYTGIFGSVKGGTIMNVTFEDISITDTASGDKARTGIIGSMQGGYVSNVKVHNLDVHTSQRGGFIGQVYSASGVGTDTFIDRVTITSDKDENGEYLHKMSCTGERIGALVGYIQAGSATGWNRLYITDCYVDAFVESAGRYASGYVGRFDNRCEKDVLEITTSIFVGKLSVKEMCGGFIGGMGDSKGKTMIMSCVSNGVILYTDDRIQIDVSAKNGSNVMGKYASNADITIRNCYAPFAEANAVYDVKVFNAVDDEGNVSFGIDSVEFWQEALTSFRSGLTHNSTVFDYENIWELVISSGSVVAPYAVLK